MWRTDRADAVPIRLVVPNDGTPLFYQQGAPLTLHLPEGALRVLAPSNRPDGPAPDVAP